MEVTLQIERLGQSPPLHAEELALRLARYFPSTVIDRQRGDAFVQAGLDRLIEFGTPEVILNSHRSYFGNVVFVSVREACWGGATATSFLHSIWSPLLDGGVVFDVQGAENTAVVDLIARELGAALTMVPVPTR